MEFQFYPVTKIKIYEKVLKNPDIIGFLSVQKKVSQTQLSRKKWEFEPIQEIIYFIEKFNVYNRVEFIDNYL